MKRKDYGFLLIIISVVFIVLETTLPAQNLAEYISDGVIVSAWLFGFYLIITSNK